MRYLFDFSSSMSHIFGIRIHGTHSDTVWHRLLVTPTWKAARAMHRIIRKLQYQLHPKHQHHIVRTGLKPGPHATNALLLHSTFSIFMKSVKDRYGSLAGLRQHTQQLQAAKPGYEPEDWLTHDQEHHKELLELASWWEETRPNLLNEVISLAKHVGEGISSKTVIDELTGSKSFVISHDSTRRDTRTLYRKKWKELRALDTEMLHRLIEIRHGLD